MSESAECWGYAQSEHAERWDGTCPTREEAIDEGRGYYGAGVGFWIMRGKIPDPAAAIMGAAQIIEHAGEFAYDNWGDEGTVGDWPDPTSEDIAELDDLLKAWARKNIQPTFWIGEGFPEFINGDDDTGAP